ncbi:TOBE domain protein [compost metagenome]
MPAGSPVGVWVRPHGLALVDAVDAPADVLTGQVSHSIFAGDRYETHVRLSDDQHLLAYQAREQLSAPGARVSILFTTSPHASALATQV